MTMLKELALQYSADDIVDTKKSLLHVIQGCERALSLARADLEQSMDDPTTYGEINGLGILQGNGMSVDNLVGKLRGQVKAYRLLKKMIDGLETANEEIGLNDTVEILATRYNVRRAKVTLLGGNTKFWDVGVLVEDSDNYCGELYFDFDEVKKI